MDAVTLSIRNPLKEIGGVGFGKHLNILSVLMNRQYLAPTLFRARSLICVLRR